MISNIFPENFKPAKFILVFAGIFLIFSGCADVLKNNSPQKTNVKTAAEKSPEAGNSYYNFVISELAQSHNDRKKSLEYLIKAQKKNPDSIFLKKVLARRYLILKQKEKAKVLISDVMKKEPDDTETLGLYGGLLALEGSSPEKIISVYKKILSLDPNDDKAVIALAFLMEKTNQRKELIKIFETAIKKSEDNYFLYFYLGEAYLLQRNYIEARVTLYKAATKEPQRIEPKLSLIETIKHLENNKKNKTEIIDLFNQIIVLNPNYVTPFVELSFFYNQNGNYEKSDETFSPVAQEWDIEKKKITALLFSYVRKKNLKKAEFLTLKIYQTTGDETILMVLAELYNDAGYKDKAILFYSSVPSNSFFFSKAMTASAYILVESEKFKKAISILEKAVAIKPDDPLLLFTLGNLHEEVKNYKQASAVYKKGTKVESAKKWSFYYRLAIVHDKMGLKEKSIESMEKALELNPENPEVLNYLGYTYAEMGINLEKARDMVLKALSAKKDDGYILDSLGWIHFKMGNYEESLSWLEKAYKTIKKDPVILEHLGDVNKKLGQKKKAESFYQKALEIEPKNKTIKEKIREIKK